MSQAIKIAALSALVLLGVETAVPKPAEASPALVQSRAQAMLERSRRRQARLNEDRVFAAEEAKIAAEAEAARRAQAAAAAASAAPTTVPVPETAPTSDPMDTPADEDAAEDEDVAETPASQI